MMPRANNAEKAAEYRLTVEEVIAGLGSDIRRGLSTEEARSRLERYGPNELEAEKPVPAWRRFLAQFRDTLVILLLVATAISIGLWVYERDSALPYEGMAIFAIVLLNGALGYIQESRAERAVAALRERGAAEHPGGRSRTGRRDTRRRGRHDPGRRTPDRVHRVAGLRSVAHGRELA